VTLRLRGLQCHALMRSKKPHETIVPEIFQERCAERTSRAASFLIWHERFESEPSAKIGCTVFVKTTRSPTDWRTGEVSSGQTTRARERHCQSRRSTHDTYPCETDMQQCPIDTERWTRESSKRRETLCAHTARAEQESVERASGHQKLHANSSNINRHNASRTSVMTATKEANRATVSC